MGIRDMEIKRIGHYAKGIGVKITKKPFYKGCGSAEWDIDTQEIIYYDKSKSSKTDIILLLLHELGHHMDYTYKSRRTSKELINAFEQLGKGPIYGYRLDLTQKQRRLIYIDERDGIHYMDIIWKELGLRVPLWKVKLAQFIDLSEYRSLFVNGKFMTINEVKTVKRTLTPKYRDRYGLGY